MPRRGLRSNAKSAQGGTQAGVITEVPEVPVEEPAEVPAVIHLDRPITPELPVQAEVSGLKLDTQMVDTSFDDAPKSPETIIGSVEDKKIKVVPEIDFAIKFPDATVEVRQVPDDIKTTLVLPIPVHSERDVKDKKFRSSKKKLMDYYSENTYDESKLYPTCKAFLVNIEVHPDDCETLNGVFEFNHPEDGVIQVNMQYIFDTIGDPCFLGKNFEILSISDVLTGRFSKSTQLPMTCGRLKTNFCFCDAPRKFEHFKLGKRKLDDLYWAYCEDCDLCCHISCLIDHGIIPEEFDEEPGYCKDCFEKRRAQKDEAKDDETKEVTKEFKKAKKEEEATEEATEEGNGGNGDGGGCNGR